VTAATPRTRVDTRPGRTGMVLGLSLVVAMIAGGLVYRGIGTIRTSREGRSAVGSIEIKSLPSTPAHLLALIDRAGRPVSFLVLAPSLAQGGMVMLVPATARIETKPGEATARLGDAYVRGGMPEQTAAVGRFLGIDFLSSFALDESALTALLAPSAPFEVAFDAPVVDTDATRSDRVIQVSGRATLTAAAAAQLLLARTDGESEAVRLVRIESLWNAIGARAAALPLVTLPAGSAASLAAPILHGPTTVYRFPAVAVTDPTRNPSGVPTVDVDIADIRYKMAQVLPGAVSVSSNGIRVEIQDPFHNPALVRDTVVLLTFLGAYVVYVHETNDPALDRTAVLYETANTRPAAEFLVNALHTSVAQLAAGPVENVDATVVLGADLLKQAAGRIAPTTTVAATVAVSTKP
jgi:hypothetical protein